MSSNTNNNIPVVVFVVVTVLVALIGCAGAIFTGLGVKLWEDYQKERQVQVVSPTVTSFLPVPTAVPTLVPNTPTIALPTGRPTISQTNTPTQPTTRPTIGVVPPPTNIPTAMCRALDDDELKQALQSGDKIVASKARINTVIHNLDLLLDDHPRL